ncbi:RluA family pseudouridine synthase [Bombilactobacillus folatiphilus]|uniref:Pseudouridine synthase n=1 Tax=Bombilactobacillus folatiphilus TaxID=2923362 RepID=A0ABY4PA64_9LACO|nr:RluA family pseudouridine synthase [Bombilactobacillus folatiphilus]UQS82625.1 RluA family pseudouridine synthase [Bombilactobacillus folatiphilus]
MILERHLILQNMPQVMNLRQLLTSWYLPRKWQHELRINRSILVNRHYQSFNQLVHNGEQIDLAFAAQIHSQTYQPHRLPNCPIIFENRDLIIVNKPAGIKTHPNQPHESQTLFNHLAAILPSGPLMLHRLDKMTSGLIMVGKNPLIVPIIERQLALKQLQRTYIAVIPYQKQMDPQGTIDFNIGRDPTDQRKRQIDPAGKSAMTHYQIIQHNTSWALVKLQLETGRTHQLRVHLKALGTPILGDPLYSCQTAPRLFLHAYQLTYQQPFTWQMQTIQTTIPTSFLALTR